MPNTSKRRSSNPDRRRLALVAAFFGAVVVTFTVVRSWRTTVASPGSTHLVTIEGMKFSPATLRIRRGDQVVFKNNDLVPHTATSQEKGLFDSGSLMAGATWSATFRTSGSFPFVCNFHPVMEGVIVVTESE